MKQAVILGICALALVACKDGTTENTETVTETQTETAEAPKETNMETKTYSKTLNLQGVAFNLNSTMNNGSQSLNVSTTGLEEREYNETMDLGSYEVVNAEVEDLNSDGSPELVVYTKDPNKNDKGKVYAFSVNNKKSMSSVNFPETESNSKINEGYRGRDEFTLVETTLSQRFPIYKEGDSDDNPTGGIRQVNYKLMDGEAMRQFEVNSVDTY